MFNAQLRSDIETLDVTINNYERMANAPEAWVRIKNALEEKFNSAAQSGPTNTTQAEILLLRVTQHLDEIKFGCLHGLKADLERYSAKHSAMR